MKNGIGRTVAAGSFPGLKTLYRSLHWREGRADSGKPSYFIFFFCHLLFFHQPTTVFLNTAPCLKPTAPLQTLLLTSLPALADRTEEPAVRYRKPTRDF